MNFVDQSAINAILNGTRTQTSPDSWKSHIDLTDLHKLMQIPAPKNLIIKCHPKIFEKIAEKYAPITKDLFLPGIFRTNDPNTTFYVTENASLGEIEIIEIPDIKIKPLWV